MADWKLKGTVLVACNCDYGCPCNYNAPPSHGECEGGWLWHVDEGRYGDVDLDGLTIGLFADWPGAIHEGNGTAVAYVDERADERQREALTALVRGETGGPWGIFINTYELAGVRVAPFDLDLADERTKARVGDAVELELEPIKNPVTGAEVHPGAVLPEGLVFKEGRFATTKTYRVEGGEVSYDHSGKHASFSPFEYSGP